MRFSTHGEDSLRHWELLSFFIPLLPLRPLASRSKLSSTLVVPTERLVRARTPAFGHIGISMVIMVYGCKRALE